uniref:RNA methyltransferase n=1 Tax=Esox lucius TaxID=8010 RepID=A0AAY5KIR9_ESOLU
MLHRRVSQDSPTTSRDLRYSGRISSTPGALPPRSFLTTSVTSARVMDESTSEPSSSASSMEDVTAGLRRSSKYSFHRPTTSPWRPLSVSQGDYLNDRELLVHNDVTAVYDVILCLGVTKWVHLHEGDGGVVRMFWRMYRHLRPGGMLLPEPQPWISYCHSKKSTEMTYRNYQDIRLRPENFSSYLTSTVGFTCYRLLTDTGNTSTVGFHRPIYLFQKGPTPRK